MKANRFWGVILILLFSSIICSCARSQYCKFSDGTVHINKLAQIINGTGITIKDINKEHSHPDGGSWPWVVRPGYIIITVDYQDSKCIDEDDNYKDRRRITYTRTFRPKKVWFKAEPGKTYIIRGKPKNELNIHEKSFMLDAWELKLSEIDGLVEYELYDFYTSIVDLE